VSTGKQKNSRVGLKLISVILAVLLWIYIGNLGGTTTRQNTMQADLRYVNLGEGLSIKKAPSKVSVKMWGTYRGSTNVSAHVDLGGLEEGTHRVAVNLDPVRGAMFTRVDPQEVEVTLTRLQEREFRVEYQLTSKLPPGYELLDLVTTPDRCIISGEANALSQVSRVVCPINLSNRTGVNSLRLRPQAQDALGNMISEGLIIIPDTVTVHAVVSQKVSSKELVVKPLFKGEVSEGYRVREAGVEPNKVSILSQEKIPADLTALNTAEIDLTGRKQSFSQEVALEVPPGGKLYPSRVLVEVIIEKIPVEEGNGSI
jgi:YbbR domain-containing protein